MVWKSKCPQHDQCKPDGLFQIDAQTKIQAVTKVLKDFKQLPAYKEEKLMHDRSEELVKRFRKLEYFDIGYLLYFLLIFVGHF